MSKILVCQVQYWNLNLLFHLLLCRLVFKDWCSHRAHLRNKTNQQTHHTFFLLTFMANKYMLFGLSSFPTVCFVEQQKFSNAPLLQKFLVYKFHSNDTTYPFTWPSFCQRYRNISVIHQPLIYCPFTGLSEIWRSWMQKCYMESDTSRCSSLSSAMWNISYKLWNNELPSFKTSVLCTVSGIWRHPERLQQYFFYFKQPTKVFKNSLMHFHNSCSFSSKNKQTNKPPKTPTGPKQTIKQKNPKHVKDLKWDSVLF